MKKIKYLLCLFVLMMFVSIVNVDAASVSIKSVKLVDSKGNATEVSEAVPNGLDIKFDLSFSDVGDSATYEVVLNNSTNKEYEINTDKQFSKSNYISYSYELKDKTNRVKANSEVTVFITIKYENPVPTSSLVDGKYVENNTMGINLLNEDNPSTANNIIFLILILLGVIGFTFLSKNVKNKEYLIIFVTLLLVPVTVFALEKLKLTVSTKITIDEKYSVYYEIDGLIPKSQLNNNDYEYSECEDLRIIEGEDYTDYVYCRDLYRKDTNIYKPGDKVDVLDNITYFNGDSEECIKESPGVFRCPVDTIKNYSMSCMSFECGIQHIRGIVSDSDKEFICTEEEFNNMNFSNVKEFNWEEDYGVITFKTPSQFTMPRHDVYITIGRFCR